MDENITGQILDAIPSPLLMWLTDGRLRECTELTPYTSSNTSNRNSLQEQSYHILCTKMLSLTKATRTKYYDVLFCFPALWAHMQTNLFGFLLHFLACVHTCSLAKNTDTEYSAMIIHHWWTIRIDDKMWTDEQEDGGSVHSAWADELVRIFREGQLEFRGHCANFMRFPSPGLPLTPITPTQQSSPPPTGCDRTKCNLIRIIKDEEGIQLMLTEMCQTASWEPSASVMTEWFFLCYYRHFD